MFYLKEGKVIDSGKRVVGFIHDSLFTQTHNREECHRAYQKGLNALEMEQISELIQKSGGKQR